MATSYDPLATLLAQGDPVDLPVLDPARGREIPVRLYLPEGTGPHAVILYSHGMGGTRRDCAYLGRHWAGRGYASAFLQHHGSDQEAWERATNEERLRARREAGSLPSLEVRTRDLSTVLDWLQARSRQPGHFLEGRLDLARVGVAGHSFGAMTAQAAAGQVFPGGPHLADPRIRAALVLSPLPPRGQDPKAAFGSVSLPWMLMTGTLDRAPNGEDDLASRMQVYEALPQGAKYHVVLQDAEHMTFTDQASPSGDPNHHRVVQALSSAFWDAFLRGEPAARAWLDGAGPDTVLEAWDLWERK